MVSKVVSAGVTALKWGVCTLAPLGLDRFLHRLQVVKALDKKNPLLSRVITLFVPSVALLRLVNQSSWKTTLAVSTVLTAFAALRSSYPNKATGKGKLPEIPLTRTVGMSYPQKQSLASDSFVRFRDLSKENKKLVIQGFYKEIQAGLRNQEAPLRIQSLRKWGPLFIKKVMEAITISDGHPNRGGMRITINEKGDCNFAIGHDTTSLESMKESDPNRAICEAHLELVMDQIEWIHAALQSNNAIADFMVESLYRHFDSTFREQSDNTPSTVGKLYNNVCFHHDIYFEEQVTMTANQRKIRFFMNEPDGSYVFEIIHMNEGNFLIKVLNNSGQNPISYKLHKILNTYYLSIEGSEREDISISQYLENPDSSMRDVSVQNKKEVSEDLPLILYLLQTIHALDTSSHTLVITESGRVQYLNGLQVPYGRLRQIAGYTNGSPGEAYLRLERDKVLFGRSTR